MEVCPPPEPIVQLKVFPERSPYVPPLKTRLSVAASPCPKSAMRAPSFTVKVPPQSFAPERTSGATPLFEPPVAETNEPDST